MSAVKHDKGKARAGLVPSVPLMKVAEVLTFGANKYGDHNWRGGFNWSRLYDAALRHILAHQNGEDVDPESGLSHLAHAACNLMFLLEFEHYELGRDDRYRRDNNKVRNIK